MRTNPFKVKSIIVLGGGTAGWLAAGYLSSQLPDVKITVIESRETPMIGVGETTVPQFRSHLEKMGIAESVWMKESGSTFKYGAKFTGWRTGGADDVRYHGFGDYLTEKTIARSPNELFKSAAMAHRDTVIDTDYWFYLLKQGIYTESDLTKLGSETYFLMKNRLAHRDLDGHQYMSRSPGYAYNINAQKVGQTIRNLVCRPLGVEHVPAHISFVEYNDDESVKSLVDVAGTHHSADLYIDCTGFRRLLIGPYSKWRSMEDRLGSKNAIGGRVQYEGDEDKWCSPELHATALKNGWSWCVPLRDDMGSGYVYDSRFTSEGEAEEELVQYWERQGKQFDPKVKLKFDNGVMERSSYRNVIACGLASNFLEPLEATSISFTTLVNELLVSIIKKHDGTWDYRDADTISRLMTREIEYTADFLWMHYALTQRQDTEFWRDRGSRREEAKQIAYKWFMDDVDIYRREKDFNHTRYNKYDWAQMITSMHIWDDCPTRPVNPKLSTRAQLVFKFKESMSNSLSSLVPSHWELIKDVNKNALVSNLPENFCVAPFVQCTTHPSASFSPCPYLGGTTWKTKNDSILSQWKGPGIESLRTSFINNKKSPICNRCWDEEKNGKQSLRLRLFDPVNHTSEFSFITNKMTYADDIINKINDKSYMYGPEVLTIKNGNVCNAKCRVCHPDDSSRWGADANQLKERVGKEYYRINSMETNWTDKQLDEIVSMSAGFKRLELFGGEPMYNKQVYKLIERIVALGHSKNIILYINTNGSVNFLDKIPGIKTFKEVEIGVSLDGVDAHFDYIRHGLEYNKVKENIKLWQEYFTANDVKFYIDAISTVEILNIYYLPELKKAVMDILPLPPFWNLLFNPAYLSIQNMPDHVKAAVIKKLEPDPEFADLINAINQPADMAEWDKFLELTGALDDIRKEDFAKTFPEFYAIINNK